MRNLLTILFLTGTILCHGQKFEAKNYTDMKGITVHQNGYVTNINSGDWVEYNVPTGFFRLTLQVANGTSTPKKFEIRNPDVVINAAVPVSGGSTKWISVGYDIKITNGKLRFQSGSDGWNFNLFQLNEYITAPSVNAGADTTYYYLSDKAYLFGSGTGDSLKYSWTGQMDSVFVGNKFIAVAPNIIETIDNPFSKLTYANVFPGVYRFMLTVVDKKGNTAYDQVIIKVLYDPNRVHHAINLGEMGLWILYCDGSVRITKN